MNLRAFYIGAILTVTIGCSVPVTTVKTIDSRPSISITGAPRGSVLFVDGVSIGIADKYDGEPNILMLEPGTHKVEIKDGSGTIYQQNIFIESELKNIKVK